MSAMRSRAGLKPGVPRRDGDAEVVFFDDAGEERARCEAELLRSGWHLPLSHRVAWDRAHGTSSHFFAARRAGGAWSYAASLRSTPTHALPGHRVVRMDRFAPPPDGELFDALWRALVGLCGLHPGWVRLDVETFSRDAQARAALGARLAERGCERLPSTRHYAHTLVLGLSPDEPALFASFNRLTRRSCRKVEGLALEIRPITEPHWDARLQELYAETMRRTGGDSETPSWAALRSLSDEQPGLSRLIGLFRKGVAGPDALLGALWGARHGDHVTYEVGVSTREVGKTVPIAHALMWSLIRWARGEGASWFDLGGVSLELESPLKGISDFKRGFAQEVVQVREEWRLRLRPGRDRALELVSGAASLARSLTRPRWIARRAERADDLAGGSLSTRSRSGSASPESDS